MTLRIEWQASPSVELVTSYIVYQSMNGAAMGLVANTSNTFYEIVNPASGIYAFQIRAVNIAGASELSDIANGPGLPSKPATPVITVVV